MNKRNPEDGLSNLDRGQHDHLLGIRVTFKAFLESGLLCRATLTVSALGCSAARTLARRGWGAGLQQQWAWCLRQRPRKVFRQCLAPWTLTHRVASADWPIVSCPSCRICLDQHFIKTQIRKVKLLAKKDLTQRTLLPKSCQDLGEPLS